MYGHSSRVENDTLVTGYRQTSGWARTRSLYFAIAFSKPFTSYGFRDDSPAGSTGDSGAALTSGPISPKQQDATSGAILTSMTEPGEQITVRVAISPVSTAGAMANMIAEAPRADFDAVRIGAEACGERSLEGSKAQ
jgi:putative alpha-1,2-mannosidase